MIFVSTGKFCILVASILRDRSGRKAVIPVHQELRSKSFPRVRRTVSLPFANALLAREDSLAAMLSAKLSVTPPITLPKRPLFPSFAMLGVGYCMISQGKQQQQGQRK
jgi:hypothetical protein